jgi:hypothetical protein
MAYKFTNNASATLAGSVGTTTTSITLTAGMGAYFPTLSAGDYFYATLIDAANNIEIVLVTARSSDTLTVVRAQDNTTARTFVAGEKCELRMTAAGIAGIETNAKTSLLTGSNVWTNDNTFSGDLAVGTTLGAWNSGYAAIQLGAGGAIAAASDLSVTHLANGIIVAGGATNYIANGYATRYKQANGIHTWSSAISGTAGSAISFTDVMVMSSGGVDVAGTITTKGSGGAFYMVDRTTSTDNWALYSQSGIARIYCGVAGSTGDKITIDSSGNFTASGSVTGTSDERLKTNWRSLPFGMSEALANVKSGIYDRTDSNITQIGVSAQSLQKVMPEAVLEGEDGMLSVAYGNAALVAVIELSKEIVKLRKEIEELRNK